MKHTDIAWLAGILDGECCLSLARMGSGEAYRPMLFLDNSSLPMIENAERIMRELGGEPHRHSPRLGSRGPLSRAALYRINLYKNIDCVLIAVLPYLVTEKREFAQSLLQLSAMRNRRFMLWTEDQRAFAREIRKRFMPRSNPQT